MRFAGLLLCTTIASIAVPPPAKACVCLPDPDPGLRRTEFPLNGHFFVGVYLELVGPGTPGFFRSPDGWRALTSEDLDEPWWAEALTPDLTRRGERKVPTVVFRPTHGPDVSAGVIVHGEGSVILEAIPRGFLQADQFYAVLAEGERVGHVVTGTEADDEPPETGRLVSASYSIGEDSTCSMGPFMQVELDGTSADTAKFEVWVDSPDSADLVPAFEQGFNTGPDACGWGHYVLPRAGRHTLFFRAVDGAGNRGATSSVEFEASPDHHELRRLDEEAAAWTAFLDDVRARRRPPQPWQLVGGLLVLLAVVLGLATAGRQRASRR